MVSEGDSDAWRIDVAIAGAKALGGSDWRAKLTANLNAKPIPEEAPAPEANAQPEHHEAAKAGLPAVVSSTPLQQSSTSCDELIAAMNLKHAIIENVGSKTLIASWEPSPLDPARQTVVFQNKESFLLRYSNQFVTAEVPNGRGGTRLDRVPLGQWWLSHPDRLQFRGIAFRPGSPKVVNECLNLWQGWGIDPKPGDWGLIRAHIEVVLAGGDKEFADYIFRWIAWAIQNPAAPAEVALVLIGEKGAGKGTLGRCLQRIFGRHAFQVTSREEVVGKFNGHLQDCVLFIVDEAYWGGDKRCVGRLQGMITEPTLAIERKGIDLIQVPNYLHVLMLAEPGWVIPAGRFERRYAAFAVSNAKRGDREYFKALHRQIAEGGAEAMMWDLARMDLGDWHPREIPESLLKGAALREQQDYTLPPLEQWYSMLLHEATLPGATDKQLNFAGTRTLIANAAKRVPRLKFELGDSELRNFLTSKERIDVAHTHKHTRVGNGWMFEPLAQSRAGWESIYGPQRWETAAEEWGDEKPRGDGGG